MSNQTNISVGDRVTTSYYSDRRAAVVIKRTAKRLVVQECEANLLNGPNSGEGDALHCEAGGFAAHISGEQRWDVRPDPNGPTRTFSLRTRRDGTQVWKATGTGLHERGGNVSEGWHPHYDYNF